MPQLAFANSFWASYDVLDKQVKAGVRTAMAKFRQLTLADLYADKGLHLESVDKARDPRSSGKGGGRGADVAVRRLLRHCPT